MTQEKIDAMVGRFIYGTNRERDAFVDEMRAEIERRQTDYGVLKNDYDALRAEIERHLSIDAEQRREIQRLNSHINKLDAEIERLKKMCAELGQSAMSLGQQLRAAEAGNERLLARIAELEQR